MRHWFSSTGNLPFRHPANHSSTGSGKFHFYIGKYQGNKNTCHIADELFSRFSEPSALCGLVCWNEFWSCRSVKPENNLLNLDNLSPSLMHNMDSTCSRVAAQCGPTTRNAENVHVYRYSRFHRCVLSQPPPIGPVLGPTPTRAKLRRQTCPSCAMLDPSWARVGAKWSKLAQVGPGPCSAQLKAKYGQVWPN